jgi:type II secretory pathway pseudopilin PulG
MIFHRLRLILNREVGRGVAPSKTPPPPLLRKERRTQGVRLFHKNQMGFTLTELMLAFAIAGIITGGITMTIFSVVDGSARTSNHMTAVRQVQNAGYWVSHDTLMAQSIEPPGGGLPLTLRWTDWVREDPGGNKYIDSHEVRYTYDAVSLRLWRYEKITTYKYDSISGWVLESTSEASTPVASYVTPIPTATVDGGALTLTVTATVQQQTETRIYEVIPRPGS